MAVKWLVVVVDGTAATAPYWPTILSDYLDKIVRYFCLQSQLQESSDSIVELGLIEYKSYGLEKGLLVQPSSWTRDVNMFMEWLAALPFNGVVLTESAIAEGLAEALVMFPKQPNGVESYQQQLHVAGGEKHCILVASSNPNSLPRPLYMPIIKNGGFLGLQTEWCLGDVETVANSYAQCGVSLSIISPMQLPKLTQLYSLGMGNDKNSEVGLVNNNDGNDFLVLISEKFPEAKAAILLNNQRQEIISTSHHVSLEFDPSSLSLCGDLLGPELSEEDMDFLREILNEPTPVIQHSHTESIGEVEPAATTVSSAAEVQPVCPQEQTYIPSTNTTSTVSATTTAQPTPQTFSSSPPFPSYQDQINTYKAMLMAEITALDHQSFNNDHHPSNDQFSSQILRSSITESHQAGESSEASVLIHDQTRFINGGTTALQGQHHQISKSSPPPLIPELQTLMGTFMQQSTENTTSSGSLYTTDHYFVAPTINASGSSSMTFHHRLSSEFGPPVLGMVNNHQNHHFQTLGIQNTTDGVVASAVPNNRSLSGPRDRPRNSSTKMTSLLPLPTRPEAFAIGQPRSSAQTTSSAGALRVSASTSSGAVNGITNSRNRVLQPFSGAPRSSSANYNNNGNYNLQQRSVPSPKALTRSRRSDQGGRVLSINNSNRHLVGAFKNHLEELYRGAGSSTHASTAGNKTLRINGGMGPFVVPYVVYENERHELAWEGSISAQYQEQLILVSRAKAYKKVSAPDALTAQWPRRLQMDHLLPLSRFSKATYQGDAEFMVFDLMANHKIYEQLKKKELCVRFNLGSQTLIFSPTKSDLRFMGTLFHGELPEYKGEAPIGRLPEPRGRQQTEEAAAYGGALAWALLNSSGF